MRDILDPPRTREEFIQDWMDSTTMEELLDWYPEVFAPLLEKILESDNDKETLSAATAFQDAYDVTMRRHAEQHADWEGY